MQPPYYAYLITNKDTGQIFSVHANAKRWGILKAFRKKESGAEAFAEAITLDGGAA